MDLKDFSKMLKRREMKFIYGILIFWGVVFLMAMKGNDSMKPFKWLLGDWATERNSGVMTESWKMVNDSSFEGKSYMTSKEGEQKVLEEMQLVYRKKGYHFISAVPGQNEEQPVSFAIKDFSDEHFLAENPAHDFPRRIKYEHMKQDSLHAWIDGGLSNADQRVDFYFSRKKQ
jgi:Domain of unknown function (DUF6265)